MRGQQWHVAMPIPQRRERNWHDLQPIKEIRAELPGLDLFFETREA
jgi:hypothetical protein